jgi:hypothetical protein
LRRFIATAERPFWTAIVAAAGGSVSRTATFAAAADGFSWTAIVAAVGGGVSWTAIVAGAAGGVSLPQLPIKSSRGVTRVSGESGPVDEEVCFSGNDFGAALDLLSGAIGALTAGNCGGVVTPVFTVAEDPSGVDCEGDLTSGRTVGRGGIAVFGKGRFTGDGNGSGPV